ncbi:hypothetical protein KSD_62630 [Ktedonobacter sp. SOSP1-85]|uniref:hypothetical protein n=1 Tax=Ktedonobacter sp. SOSP1-85 TaxID=2778367 RepID=UPI001916271D|nr:hypothetical protein [Ktedonobacter sp. SOSP1-85]GHO78492.1 hypothetical protein KSD_62630 [Ktedonobacter sp. SOSP1-85]
MSGFTNNDGSGLVGALNPQGIGQTLRVDTGGNLLVTGGTLQNALLSGKSFSATTGKQTASSAAVVACSLYNNTSANILLYSITCLSGSIRTHQLTRGTSNLALGSNALVSNASLGGNSSLLPAGNVTYANSNQTISGTALDAFSAPAGQLIEVLGNGSLLLLPASASNSLTLYLDLAAAGDWKITYKWLEI